jgi:hypothetical protein
MAVLAERGVDLPIAPNGPVVRMVDQEIVRNEFYAQTASDGTPEQKNWAEEQELIGIREIKGLIYFWLSRPEPSQGDI